MHRPRRTPTALALAVAALAAHAPAAHAADATATGTINAGGLSVTTSAAPTFSATLDGTDKTPTYTVPVTVIDATGSGAGWNATLTSTPFSTGGGSPKTLAAGASAVTGVTSACAGGTCTAPTNGVAYPFTVPAGVGATPVKLFNAALATGLGQFSLVPTIGVSVPANTAAGTYTSTLTFAAVSGP